MRTNIPEILLKFSDEIAEHGNANLTKLVVLKKWFGDAARLSAFAVWIATRATSRKGKTGGAVAELFREAKALLAMREKDFAFNPYVLTGPDFNCAIGLGGNPADPLGDPRANRGR
jgi:UbiD family decarboxylase